MILVDGFPRSEWDVAGEKLYGSKPSAGTRYVPGSSAGFSETSITGLYAEDAHKRGRPLRFSLKQAAAIARAYWTGAKTIAELARENRVTTVTISRLVHGETYWYIERGA